MIHRNYAVNLTFVPGTQGCIFRCSKPSSTATLDVGMVVAPDGRFLGGCDDADGSRRENGVAHPECYDAFYRVVYGVPFLTA